MSSCTSFVLLCFLCCTAAEALVEVTNTLSPVRTRVGCEVVLTCGGNGTSIEWRRFGSSVEVEMSENLIVNTTEYLLEGVTHSYFVANLTLAPATRNDRYSCVLTRESRVFTHTVTIRVDEAAVSIVPAINNVDISTYHVNSKVTIGCPVQTCAADIQVQFLHGDREVGRVERERVEDMSIVYNLVLDVSEDILGTYVCKVDTTDPDDSAMQFFNVTGTPLPPTMPPSVSTDGSNTPPSTTSAPNNNDGNGDNGDNGDSSLPQAVTVPLLLSLLLLAIMHSL